jgi:hypothetical protein
MLLSGIVCGGLFYGYYGKGMDGDPEMAAVTINKVFVTICPKVRREHGRSRTHYRSRLIHNNLLS